MTDVKQVGGLVEIAKVTDSKYPASLNDINIEEDSGQGNKIVYTYNTNNPQYDQFCLSGRSKGRTFFVTDKQLSPRPGNCEGIVGVENDGSVSVTSCVTTGISVNTGETQLLNCPVPAGKDWMAVNLYGGTGYGPRYYVVLNGTPSSSNNSCTVNASSYMSGQCVYHQPQAGDWFTLINPTVNAMSNATLEVIWGSYGSGTQPYVAPNVTVSGEHFSRQSHSIEVAPEDDYLAVSFAGSGGSTGTYGAAIALKHGSRPGLNNKDVAVDAACNTSGSAGTTDQCIVVDPEPGTWYIETYAPLGTGGSVTSGMARNQSYTDVVVEASKASFGSTNQYTAPVTLSGAPFSRTSYKVTVPSGATKLTVTTAGGTYTNYGAGLAVKEGSRPGAGSVNPGAGAVCDRPSGTGNGNSCVINAPAAGEYYMEVYSYYGNGGYSSILQGRNQSFANTVLTATIE